MSTFKYGDLKIRVERLTTSGLWQEYGVRILALDHPIYAFKIWHASNKAKKVAQVLVYDLIEAYEDPMQFLKRHNDPSYLPESMRSSVEVNREFIHVAKMLQEFLPQAHRDVHRQWSKRQFTGRPIERGPREWFPERELP